MKFKFLSIPSFIIIYFFLVSFNNVGLINTSICSSEREVNLKLIYKVSVNGHLNSMRLKMIIPDNIKNRQTINDISFSIEPDSIYKSNSNTYALFRFYDIDKSFKIV